MPSAGQDLSYLKLSRLFSSVQAAGTQPQPPQPSSPSCSANAEPSSQLHKLPSAAMPRSQSPLKASLPTLQPCQPSPLAVLLSRSKPASSHALHRSAAGQKRSLEQAELRPFREHDRTPSGPAPGFVAGSTQIPGQVQVLPSGLISGQTRGHLANDSAQAAAPSKEPFRGIFGAAKPAQGASPARSQPSRQAALSQHPTAPASPPRQTQLAASSSQHHTEQQQQPKSSGTGSEAERLARLPLSPGATAEEDFEQHLHKVVHHRQHQGRGSAAASQGHTMPDSNDVEQPPGKLPIADHPCGMARRLSAMSCVTAYHHCLLHS